ncbi:uncharacterized protein DUF3558 [Amycolatopsis sulphurea]|uniref:Uncharacterized protein DUF3558 n=1 Tax=Amycolatopsis sulphurea TaxID=76022 RepID=A0A2A9FAC6_9PSEU|nr:DUF3558 domain-containing protein [Amycolatopsis sulphurea]PFG48377.1 uncharacterized protein DUF3558 [Amycolatopsis sulphurea]
MRARYLTAIICSTIVGVSISGCSSGSSGQATPAPSSSPAGDPFLAPRVASPIIDTKSYESDPCSAVSASDVEKLGGPLKKTGVNDTENGKLCVWTFTDLHGSASAGIPPTQNSGINGLYLDHQKGYLTSFQPHAPIDGYPVVFYARGGEATGNCNLAVGIRDDLAYVVIILLRSGPAESNPCGIAEKIATTAIEHMKGK